MPSDQRRLQRRPAARRRQHGKRDAGEHADGPGHGSPEGDGDGPRGQGMRERSDHAGSLPQRSKGRRLSHGVDLRSQRGQSWPWRPAPGGEPTGSPRPAGPAVRSAPCPPALPVDGRVVARARRAVRLARASGRRAARSTTSATRPRGGASLHGTGRGAGRGERPAQPRRDRGAQRSRRRGGRLVVPKHRSACRDAGRRQGLRRRHRAPADRPGHEHRRRSSSRPRPGASGSTAPRATRDDSVPRARSHRPRGAGVRGRGARAPAPGGPYLRRAGCRSPSRQASRA